MKQTISKTWCQARAKALEEHAKDQLQALMILGDTSKYWEILDKAHKFKTASEIQILTERREFLTHYELI